MCLPSHTSRFDIGIESSSTVTDIASVYISQSSRVNIYIGAYISYIITDIGA